MNCKQLNKIKQGKWVWFRNPDENESICSGRVVSCMGSSTTVKDFNGKVNSNLYNIRINR